MKTARSRPLRDGQQRREVSRLPWQFTTMLTRNPTEAPAPRSGAVRRLAETPGGRRMSSMVRSAAWRLSPLAMKHTSRLTRCACCPPDSVNPDGRSDIKRIDATSHCQQWVGHLRKFTYRRASSAAPAGVSEGRSGEVILQPHSRTCQRVGGGGGGREEEPGRRTRMLASAHSTRSHGPHQKIPGPSSIDAIVATGFPAKPGACFMLQNTRSSSRLVTTRAETWAGSAR